MHGIGRGVLWDWDIHRLRRLAASGRANLLEEADAPPWEVVIITNTWSIFDVHKNMSVFAGYSSSIAKTKGLN